MQFIPSFICKKNSNTLLMDGQSNRVIAVCVRTTFNAVLMSILFNAQALSRSRHSLMALSMAVCCSLWQISYNRCLCS